MHCIEKWKCFCHATKLYFIKAFKMQFSCSVRYQILYIPIFVCLNFFLYCSKFDASNPFNNYSYNWVFNWYFLINQCIKMIIYVFFLRTKHLIMSTNNISLHCYNNDNWTCLVQFPSCYSPEIFTYPYYHMKLIEHMNSRETMSVKLLQNYAHYSEIF